MEIENQINPSTQLEKFTMLTVIGRGGYAKVILVRRIADE
jgi:hypothetical protein